MWHVICSHHHVLFTPNTIYGLTGVFFFLNWFCRYMQCISPQRPLGFCCVNCALSAWKYSVWLQIAYRECILCNNSRPIWGISLGSIVFNIPSALCRSAQMFGAACATVPGPLHPWLGPAQDESPAAGIPQGIHGGGGLLHMTQTQSVHAAVVCLVLCCDFKPE